MAFCRQAASAMIAGMGLFSQIGQSEKITIDHHM
jgi:hypothetical protein